MARAHYRHVKIGGVCTVVPKGRIRLDDERSYYQDLSRLVKLQKTVGLSERSVVGCETTPADLMEVAARKIISGMGLDVADIDALLCVLDYPDYRCPPTSCVLHGKLGLPQTCIAFDINHGCAGYVYGLHVAHSLVESGAAKKILLLVGDTKSRTIDVRDRISAPVFGDGAAATLIEYSEHANDSYFVLGANGALHSNIIIPAGGARHPSTEETKKPRADEFGNVRSLENFTMNGRAVFDFTMTAVPQNISDAFEFSGIDAAGIDYFVIHQANKSIILNIAMRIGVRDFSKVPVATLSKYGNLAVASIPSVMSDQLGGVLSSSKRKLLMSGFGVGLAYGTAILEVGPIFAPETYIYEEEMAK